MARGTRDFGSNKQNACGAETQALREEFNKLLDEFDALCTKLNADATVTDTNYGATQTAKKVI